MDSNYTEVLLSTEYALVADAQDAHRLKAYLARKLESYAGITHNELADICAMFGIGRRDDSE